MHHGAFHHNGKASGTRERLIEGIFNSCYSYCLHFYVACLLAQLTAPNMVQCRLRLHYLKTKGGDRSVLMELCCCSGGALLYCTQDAVRIDENQASPNLTLSLTAETAEERPISA